MLQEALDVIKAWGFKYKTVFHVWVKTNKGDGEIAVNGVGWWTRSNAELLLIGTRGKDSVQKALVLPGTRSRPR